MKKHSRVWGLVSLVVVAMGCSACASGDPDETGSEVAGNDAVWNEIVKCGLAGTFGITKMNAPMECADMPASAEDVVIEQAADGSPRMRVGAYEIPVSLGEDCVLSSASCSVPSDAAGYVELNATAFPTPQGISVQLAGTSIELHKPSSCPGTSSFIAVPRKAGACDVGGLFIVDSSPQLVSGTCDLQWSAMPLTILDASGSEPAHVQWGDAFLGEEFDSAEVNDKDCSLSATKGTEFSAYFYNGVARTIGMKVKFVGDTVQGTIEDSLEGVSDFGERCRGVFEFTGHRFIPGGTKLDASCEIERPYVCGDGVCEQDAGENCGVCAEDCGCSGSDVCYAEQCVQPCNVWNANCESGERCQVPNSGSFPGGYCLSEGSVGEGSRCNEDLDCAAGLLCQRDWDQQIDGVGICLRWCSSTPSSSEQVCDTLCTPDSRPFSDNIGGCKIACDATTKGSCGEDAFCWERYSNQQPYCWPKPFNGLPGVGEPCLDPKDFAPHCDETLSCIGLNGFDGEFVCSTDCNVDADCPASLPKCSGSGGYCIK